MDLDLSPEVEDLIRRKVRSGSFASASEVVHEALRLMEERDLVFDGHEDEVREQIAAGMRSLRAGRSREGEAVFDRILAGLDVDGPKQGS